MYENVGGKIKKMAAVLCWIGIILSVIMAIMDFVAAGNVDTDGWSRDIGEATETALIVEGLIWLVLGPIAFWLGSLCLRGFGELVENSSILVKKFAPELKNEEGSFGTDTQMWIVAKNGIVSEISETSLKQKIINQTISPDVKVKRKGTESWQILSDTGLYKNSQESKKDEDDD